MQAILPEKINEFVEEVFPFGYDLKVNGVQYVELAKSAHQNELLNNDCKTLRTNFFY